MSNRLPHFNPTTRHEARENALYYANACYTYLSGQADVTAYHQRQAEMWARLAAIFPEDPDIRIMMADDQPVGVVRHRDVVQVADISEYTPQADALGRTTVTLDSTVYDVLRALAVRYLSTSMTGATIVSRGEWSQGTRDIEVRYQPPTDDYRLTLVDRGSNGE